MNAPLDTTVFKLPNFAQEGYRLEEREQQKAEQKEAKREREVYATGAEKAYSENKYRLTGDALNGANMLYQEFSKAAVAYERSGSESDKMRMQDYASQLNSLIGIVSTQNDAATRSFQTAEANGYKGYAATPDVARRGYSNFMSRKMEFSMQNGQLMVKENGQLVPAFQSSFLSPEVNQMNSYIVPRAIQAGKFVVPQSYIGQYATGIQNAGDIDSAKQVIRDQFEYDFKNNRDFAQDVAVFYAIEVGKIDPSQGITAEQMAEAAQMLSDEKMMNRAIDAYMSSLNEGLDQVFDMAKPKTTNIASLPGYVQEVDGTEVQMRALPKPVDAFSAVGVDKEGNYYVTEGGQIIDKATNLRSAEVTRRATPREIAQIQSVGRLSFSNQVSEVDPPSGSNPGKPKPTGGSTPGSSIPTSPGNPRSVDNLSGNENYAMLYPDKTLTMDQIQKYIDHKSGGKSPVKATDIVSVAEKTGVPVELLLVQAAVESRFGTTGRSNRTKNIYNWGNTDGGDVLSAGEEQDRYNRYMKSFIDGMETYASRMAKLYKPESGDWSELIEGSFVQNPSGNAPGSRYATDPDYEKKLRTLVNEVYNMFPAENQVTSRQVSFNAEEARAKYNY